MGNLICYPLGAPNFRPSFRYFNRWTALLGIEQRVVLGGGISSIFLLAGTLGNIGVMFYLSWLYGIIATAILLAVFVYLVISAPDKDWGEISQAIMFHQVGLVRLRVDAFLPDDCLCRCASICSAWTPRSCTASSGAPTSCLWWTALLPQSLASATPSKKEVCSCACLQSTLLFELFFKVLHASVLACVVGLKAFL
jgi:hypothetical protein